MTSKEIACCPSNQLRHGSRQDNGRDAGGEMPSAAEIAACQWMNEKDMQVYSTEFTRTGFQGGLNSYRILEDSRYDAELNLFSGRTIDVPACYIAGGSEWGVNQSPGAFEAMQHGACTRLLGFIW
jgi:hypothetical protein